LNVGVVDQGLDRRGHIGQRFQFDLLTCLLLLSSNSLDVERDLCVEQLLLSLQLLYVEELGG
jgi:hypothetical protein